MTIGFPGWVAKAALRGPSRQLRPKRLYSSPVQTAAALRMAILASGRSQASEIASQFNSRVSGDTTSRSRSPMFIPTIRRQDPLRIHIEQANRNTTAQALFFHSLAENCCALNSQANGEAECE